MEKHVIKLSSIASFFKEEEKLIAKGENAVESGHVTNMLFDASLKTLRAKVHASMKDRHYNINIHFNDDWLIEEASCSCPRGQYLCHHMAAVVLFGHSNVSITDQTCSWSEKKASKEVVKKITDLYTTKQHRATNRNLTEDEIEKFQKKLQIFDGAVGFTWLLSEEKSAEASNLVEDIEDLLFSDDYAAATNKLNYFKEKMEVSADMVTKVVVATIGQSVNEKWLIYRKNRLTASNFGIVLAACRRNRYPPSLFKRLVGTYSLDHIKAIQWGKQHEEEALKIFENAENVKVVSTGLWLHECGFLGASPDGLVGDDAIVEIKCPYKYREVSMIHSIKCNTDYIISSDNDGNITINKNHIYYQQIQGQLALTKRVSCHLVVWTPKETIIVHIGAEDFSENINSLKNFYLNHYIPFLTGETNFL